MTFIAGVSRPGNDAQDIGAAIESRVPLDASSWRTLTTHEITFSVATSIRVPEDIHDRQPLSQGGLLLIGDIRLDNRGELTSLLGWTLLEAKEKADSDFFLAAWDRWGQAALQHLVGGFAVAVWDKRSRELTLVRDHMGERSLYFLHSPKTLAFASLPTCLRAVPNVDTSLDEERLVYYLAMVPGGPTQTFFKNIQQIPIGHLLTYRDGVVTLRRYWHPLDASPTRFKSDQDYVEAFRDLFDRTVTARLRTTGKIGSQLSGGMDSSSVTATAARLLGDKRLTAFTSVPQPGFANQNPTGRFGNEGPAAAQVAAMYPNIDHVLIDASGEDMLGIVQQIGRLQGQPVFNPLNEMWLCAIVEQARKRGITVMLQGTCGNATLSAGGMIGLSELFRSGRWLKLARLVVQLRGRGHTSWRGAASWACTPVLPEWMRRKLSPELARFDFSFSPVHPRQAAVHNLPQKTCQEFYGKDGNAEEFRRQMYEYYDAGFANVATTLGWQVELRDPTQDKRIFEFCFSIPIEQYLVGGQTRSLVRRVMRGRLPESTLNCTTRGLQSADWFLTMGARRQQMQEELSQLHKSPAATRLLDLDRLGSLLNDWPAEGFNRASVVDSWYLALSRGLSAGNFIRQFE